MNDLKIETYAIHAVADMVNLVDYFASFISENDKTPSWDGSIYIYNNSELRKKGVDVLPVQVKGTEQKNFSRNIIKKAVKRVDLENFQTIGGGMYFVVYLNREEKDDGPYINRKVYYRELTPVMIFKEMEKMKPEQKSRKIEFKTLPNDPKKIDSIIRSCRLACKMQSSYSGKPLPLLDDLTQLYPKGNVKIIGPLSNSEKPLPDIIFDEEAYRYFELPGIGTLIPLGDDFKSTMISQEVKIGIFVKGINFYESYTIVYDSNHETTVQIGSGLSIIKTADKKIITSFSFFRMLSEYVENQRFMLACIENKGFEVGEKHYSIEPSEQDLERLDLKLQKSLFAFYEKTKKVFDMLHCRDDLDLTSLNKEDRHNIQLIIDGFLNNEELISNENMNLRYVSFKVGSLIFIFITKKAEKGFRISDFFDNDDTIEVSGLDGHRFNAPHYYLLRAEDFIKASNIQFDTLLPAFTRFEISENLLAITNLFLLELIKAYDQASDWRKNELYRTAINFSNWLLEAPENLMDRHINVINKFQLVKRKRALNEQEIAELHRIQHAQLNNECMLVCVDILLGNYEKARELLDEQSDPVKAAFIEYPIYSLLKEDRKDTGEYVND